MRETKDLFLRISPEAVDAFQVITDKLGYKARRWLMEDVIRVFMAAVRFIWRAEEKRLSAVIEKAQQEAAAATDPKAAKTAKVRAEMARRDLEDARGILDVIREAVEVSGLDDVPDLSAPLEAIPREWGPILTDRQRAAYRMKTDAAYRRAILGNDLQDDAEE